MVDWSKPRPISVIFQSPEDILHELLRLQNEALGYPLSERALKRMYERMDIDEKELEDDRNERGI